LFGSHEPPMPLTVAMHCGKVENPQLELPLMAPP
jgi:hypothetical protein